jgi:soluble P-type ATPase
MPHFFRDAGDHPLTAQSIADRLGITKQASIVTGPQLDRLSAADLEQVADSSQIYARVSPEHKLKIVEGLQRRGHVVAMTGDGVNDAPALKRADIGVAMGIAGTDVAREAADMVLLDDNFATIVAAVEVGRVIYDNVRKFIRYILATNAGEIVALPRSTLSKGQPSLRATDPMRGCCQDTNSIRPQGGRETDRSAEPALGPTNRANNTKQGKNGPGGTEMKNWLLR